MNTRNTGAGLLLGGCLAFFSVQGPEDAAAQPAVVVGTYDSRAVAVAFAQSPQFSEFIRELKKDVGSAIERARQYGDGELVAALEAVGPDLQHRMHLWAFGGAPIDDIMARLQPRLPEIAKAAGVDVIVSRWELDWQVDGAEFVDVTAALAGEFLPSEKVQKLVEQMAGVDLVPLDELKKHDH